MESKKLINAFEVINNNITQLQALLTLTYGTPREGFNELTEETKQNYMWTCYTLTENIKSGIETLEKSII